MHLLLSSTTSLFVSLLLFGCTCDFARCFNLEDRNPIIKQGEEGSYFGFSVAQHKVGDGLLPGDNWILVGAPLGKNLQPNTNRSGALFKCNILSSSPRDCTQIVTDGRRADPDDDYIDSENVNTGLKPPEKDEIKEGQWLGVTVKSQGPHGKVLVCAHRYIYNPSPHNHHLGLGLCYVLQNNFEWETEVEPCKGRGYALAHEQFGVCQAGTSLSVLSDGTAIIGSPGTYTWRGTMFVQSIKGQFLERQGGVYLGPLNDTPDPIEKYSYLGMSVAAGNFFGNGISYAGGAPRSQEKGQIYFFTKNSNSHNNYVMNVTLLITGEQFASNFGYEICAADVNNDKFTDLIVGAPFYFSRNEGGKIYVYQNLRTCGFDCRSDINITGPVESRFGFSIANLGDINKDGYEDIAVGAPYEGFGAVYIYLGSENGLMATPSQKIHPERRHISTLGYSLSAGMDMDNNGYPDLLVGAYESDKVLLFKARPIFNITIEVDTSELKNIDVTKSGCRNYRKSENTCFSFITCCSIQPLVNAAKTLKQQLKYVVEAETFEPNRKYSRVYFRSDIPNQYNSFKVRYINVESGRTNCTTETVILKKDTRDILTSIKFRVNYTLTDDQAGSPILNQQRSFKRFAANFQKDCGDDDICQSNMVVSAQLLSLPEHESKPNTYILTVGNVTELGVEVNVTNLGESAYEAQLFVNHSTDLSYIGTQDKSAVKCNYKNEELIVCSLGNPLKNESRHIIIRFEPKQEVGSQSELNFRVFANSTSKEMSRETKVSLKAIVEKKAEVKILGKATNHILYGGEVKGESAMQYFDNIGHRVWHTYQVINEGPGQAENVNVYIEWPWQVANNKPQGKWLLYLESEPTVEVWNSGTYKCEPLSAKINPLNLTSRPGIQDQESPPDNLLASPFQSSPPNNNNRKKRDAEMVIKSDTIEVGGQKRETVTMECGGKVTAKCVKFRCKIPKLSRQDEAIIKIRSRLWNSTLVEDYPRVYWVGIKSRAWIEIDDTSVKQSTDDDMAEAETRAYPDLDQQEAAPVPLWIYIVAIIIGLLLLILLAFILYKCGFFKRQRVDQTLSGNLQKSSKEAEPLVSSRNK